MSDNLVIFGSSRSDGKTREAVVMVFGNKAHRFVDLAAHNISYYDYSHLNQSDDFLSIADLMAKHRNIFFCTPVYWYSMSAIMKTFFDRLSDLLDIQKPLGRSLKGRKCYIISSGADDKLPECFLEQIKRTCDYFEMEYVHALYYYTGKDAHLVQQNESQIRVFQNAIWANPE